MFFSNLNNQQPIDNKGNQQPIDNQGNQQPIDNQGNQQPIDNQGNALPIDNQDSQQSIDNQSNAQPIDNQSNAQPIDNALLGLINDLRGELVDLKNENKQLQGQLNSAVQNGLIYGGSASGGQNNEPLYNPQQPTVTPLSDMNFLPDKK